MPLRARTCVAALVGLMLKYMMRLGSTRTCTAGLLGLLIFDMPLSDANRPLPGADSDPGQHNATAANSTSFTEMVSSAASASTSSSGLLLLRVRTVDTDRPPSIWPTGVWTKAVWEKFLDRADFDGKQRSGGPHSVEAEAVETRFELINLEQLQDEGVVDKFLETVNFNWKMITDILQYANKMVKLLEGLDETSRGKSQKEQMEMHYAIGESFIIFAIRWNLFCGSETLEAANMTATTNLKSLIFSNASKGLSKYDIEELTADARVNRYAGNQVSSRLRLIHQVLGKCKRDYTLCNRDDVDKVKTAYDLFAQRWKKFCEE